MEAIPRRLGNHPLRKFFTILTEKNFYEQLGWPDQRVIRYVADLLTEFSDAERLYRVRDDDGRRTLVSDLLRDAEATPFGFPRRDVHRHIGDFTLFMMGLFPEHLSRLKTRTLISAGDFLLDYVRVGKRSYRIVSEMGVGGSDGDETVEVFRKLSEHFELCVAGLSCIRGDLHRRNVTFDRFRERWLN